MQTIPPSKCLVCGYTGTVADLLAHRHHPRLTYPCPCNAELTWVGPRKLQCSNCGTSWS